MKASATQRNSAYIQAILHHQPTEDGSAIISGRYVRGCLIAMISKEYTMATRLSTSWVLFTDFLIYLPQASGGANTAMT